MSERVLVCGGRYYEDQRFVDAVLDKLHETHGIAVVIAGGKLRSPKRSELARGADKCGLRWAESRGVEWIECPADWDRYGNAAGPIRNSEMLREHRPTLVVSLPGGTGTADMVRKAKRAGVEVLKWTAEALAG